MISESFAVGTSVIHRLDPRLKISAAVSFSVVVAVSYRIPTLVLALVAATLLVVAAGLDSRRVLRRLMVLAGFLCLLWLILPLGISPAAGFSRNAIHFSPEGTALAVQITLKSIAILTAFMALVATMHLATLGHALERLRVSSKLVHLLLMTYRYIFVIEAEYQRLVRAAKIRGFRADTSLHTYKTVAYFLGMLFVRAASRAERVHHAMRCRGFNGRFHCLADFPPHPGNRLFTALMVTLVCALSYMEWGW